MKNKIKKSIKYIIVFTSVFVLAFCSLSICSLGAENEGLEFSFYSAPILYVWNGESWEQSNVVSCPITVTTLDEGQEQKLTLSIEPYSSGFEVGKFYRVSIRFRLEGDFAHDTECSFGMRFTAGTGSIGVGSTSYNPSAFIPNSSKKSQTFGNIWYYDGDVREVRDSAEITEYSLTDRTFTCRGYKYSYPEPSLNYDIRAYQLSYGFIVSSNQTNRVEIVMEDFSFPLILPEFSNTAINEYENLENDIILGTQEGRDGAISIFNTAGGFINNRGNGIMAVGSILNEFFQITAFSELINIALALGLFAFVVGMSVLVVRNIKPNKEE